MTSGLLLDTCAAIWILENEPLTPASITAMDEAFDAGVGTFVSPVTAWEFGMLLSRNRIKMRYEALTAYRLLLERAGIGEQQMTAEMLIASSNLPGVPPRDPFDRIVIATARQHDLTILTRDSLILAYAEAGHARALAC